MERSHFIWYVSTLPLTALWEVGLSLLIVLYPQFYWNLELCRFRRFCHTTAQFDKAVDQIVDELNCRTWFTAQTH